MSKRKPRLVFFVGESRSGFRLSPRQDTGDVTATKWRRALDASDFQSGDRVVMTLAPEPKESARRWLEGLEGRLP